MKQKRGRAYIEITNICNRSCSFCPPHQRKLEMISLDFFRKILKQIKPFARELYFHLMGEPTLHPQLAMLLDEAIKEDYRVNITTNGTNLSNILHHRAIRQVNFSLQSIPKNEISLLQALLFWIDDASQKRPDCYYNLRFWNHTPSENHTLLLSQIANHYNRSIDSLSYDGIHHQVPLKLKINIHHESLFQWPCTTQKVEVIEPSYCLGLADQFGILVNGDVVPCCLDAQGELVLGNLHETSFQEIIHSPKATLFLKAFQKNIPPAPLCENCTYRLRFK